MFFEDTICQVNFVHSGETSEVPLSALVRDAVAFLEHYGEAYLMGKDFNDVIGEGDGETRLARLLTAAGYQADVKSFFAEVTDKLRTANSADNAGIEVNGVKLPNLFVLSLLEKIMPGHRFISIRNVDQFEKLKRTGILSRRSLTCIL
jgi:hypothetical protein